MATEPEPEAMDPPNGAPLPQGVESAWQQVLASWSDEDQHKKFLAVCEALGCLDEAGARYKSIRDSDPDRAELARLQIDRLIGLAFSKLRVMKTEPRQRPRFLLNAFAVLMALGLIGSALYLYSR